MISEDQENPKFGIPKGEQSEEIFLQYHEEKHNWTI